MALLLLTGDLVAAGLFYEPDGGIRSGRILDVDAVREHRCCVSIDVRIGEEVLQHGSGAAGTGRAHVAVSVPGHTLRCGPETSVTSPLRWRSFELRGHEKTYIQSSRPWECGNPEGISKECGKGGKPALWLSMLSILCHFHGLLFARQCWINRYAATQRNAPHPPRDAYRTHRLSMSALAILYELSLQLDNFWIADHPLGVERT